MTLQTQSRKIAQEAVLLSAENRQLRAALKRIARWFGEFPPTNRCWEDDPERPMSYGACFGSNGERDYMREVACKALAHGEER